MRAKLRKIPVAEVATSLLEVAGLALLVAFAYAVWAPAALAAGGVACLAVSWRLAGSPLPARRLKAQRDLAEGIR